MRQDYLEQCVGQIDAMIATIHQGVVLGNCSDREIQARELLKEARLKLVQEIEASDAFDIGMMKLREQGKI